MSGLNHLMHDGQPKPKKYKVIRSTSEAKDHYDNGNGESVVLDKKTRQVLRNTSAYKRVLSRLQSGVANKYSSSFDVDMTGEYFHVGDNNVDYSTTFNSNGTATTTFTEFVRDGFWDPNVVSEFIGGGLGIDSCQPDGMGPNLETSGGHPYRYVPSTFTINYPTYSPVNQRFK